MATGKLVVEVSYAQEALPVGNVQVRVYSDNNCFNRTYITNEEGKTPVILLNAPDAALSLDETSTQLPYSSYNIEIIKNGAIFNRIRGVQIFADATALQQVELNPIRSIDVDGNDIVIPTHSLYDGTGGSGRGEEVDDRMQFVLAYPIIPSQMRVHLGRPGSNAKIVTVSFKDYIKNVASSEIYPTWPDASLRANIYCQISLAMNRVYTEWYPSKGYNFDITNSTAFDQAFVYGRNIFDSVSKIVDELFMQYVRKVNTINPYYTEYCDGKQVTNCPGLKQWGTVTYANQGLNPLEILRRYYTNIEIVTTDRIEQNVGSFPGYNLKVGMRDNNVAIIQNQINRISVNYPLIKPVIPVDGNFTTELETSIKVFQRQFNLTPDGVVGRATWYKISYIYVAVKKLAELTSEGEQSRPPGVYPGTVLREGSSGPYVQEMQFYLDTIADYTPLVTNIQVDGIFGRGTRASVVNFQNLCRITPDGLVGQTTWNYMVRAYKDTQLVDVPVVPPVVPWPGNYMRLGSRGEDVKALQYYLNRIYLGSSTVSQLTVDGIFGSATDSVVRTFQREQELSVDGIVGPSTWDRVVEVYNNIITYALINESNYQVYDFTTANSINLMYNR